MNLKITLIYLPLLFITNLLCAQMVSKKIIETFSIDQASHLNIDVGSNKIEIRDSNISYVHCEINIKLATSNQKLLDFVGNSGRYNLIRTFEDSTNTIWAHTRKSNNVIVLKGEEIREEISYIFYVPCTIVANKSVKAKTIIKDTNNLAPKISQKATALPATDTISNVCLVEYKATNSDSISNVENHIVSDLALNLPIDFSLYLYPVPIIDVLTLQFHQLPETVKSADLFVKDLQGRTIFFKRSVSLDFGKTLEIEGIDECPTGVYILQIRLDNGTSVSKQFIKQ